MPRPRKSSELLAKTLSVRLPERVAARWRSEALSSGHSLGDWVRHRVDAEHAPITGLPTPRRRPKAVGRVSGADPALLRQLVTIGSLANQVARAVNGQAARHQPIDVIRVLVELGAIERKLKTLAVGEAVADAPQVPAA